MVVLWQSSCIRAKVVSFGQNCFYSGKSFSISESGSVWAKVVVFGQNGCIRIK